MYSELYEKLAALQWLVRKNHLSRFAEMGPLGDTTRGQGRILAFLKMRDGISTRDLSYLLGIRVSSLNELLSKLEKSGYITREPSDSDKRVMLVRLTELGRSENQPDIMDKDDIFGCLTPEEAATLEGYLDRVIAALGEKTGETEMNIHEHMQNAWRRFAGAIDERFDRRDPRDHREARCGRDSHGFHDGSGRDPRDCGGRGWRDFEDTRK